jgi:hypothetical protein
MFDYLYDISTVRLAIYCVGFFIVLMWLGIIFIKPFLRILIGRQPGINDLVFDTTSGFSLYYGLLLGLLTVAVYQNLEEVRQNISDEASKPRLALQRFLLLSGPDRRQIARVAERLYSICYI